MLVTSANKDQNNKNFFLIFMQGPDFFFAILMKHPILLIKPYLNSGYLIRKKPIILKRHTLVTNCIFALVV